MKRSILSIAVCLTVVGAGLSSPAQARHYRHYHHRYSQYRDQRDDHGNCLRFNKTTGTVAGAVGGGLLGPCHLWRRRRRAGWRGSGWPGWARTGSQSPQTLLIGA